MKYKTIIILIIFIILITSCMYSDAKYISNGASVSISAQYANPIVTAVTKDPIDGEVGRGYKSQEYKFYVTNYYGIKRSEVEMEYKIIIQNSNSQFPIKCTLKDIRNQVCTLDENMSTSVFSLKKAKDQTDVYKLTVEYENNEFNNKDDNQVSIIVLAWQKR